jgi:hypothetical protein
LAREKGSQRTFRAYCDSQGLAQGLFGPLQAIRDLAESFGKENLVIRLYGRENMKNGSILDDFADIFGINIPLVFPKKYSTAKKIREC